MCIDCVPSLRTAPARNFDGVMLVLIRYLAQPVRHGNATHQVHGRRDVNDQNLGCWCILRPPGRRPSFAGDHTRTEYSHDKRTTHNTKPEKLKNTATASHAKVYHRAVEHAIQPRSLKSNQNPINHLSNEASRCGVAW